MGGEVLRIVIDIGVFFRREIWLELAEFDDDIVLPAVAFTERARQLSRQGINPRDFQIMLHMFDIEIEPFRAQEGLLRAVTADDDWWKLNARDALIGGHVGPSDMLWTTNPKDFIKLGINPNQIVAC
jgi:hypothetical protein